MSSAQDAVDDQYRMPLQSGPRRRLTSMYWRTGVQALTRFVLMGVDEATSTRRGPGEEMRRPRVAVRRSTEQVISLKSILKNLGGTVPRIARFVRSLHELHSPEIVIGYIMIFNALRTSSKAARRGATYSAKARLRRSGRRPSRGPREPSKTSCWWTWMQFRSTDPGYVADFDAMFVTLVEQVMERNPNAVIRLTGDIIPRASARRVRRTSRSTSRTREAAWRGRSWSTSR